ncbi:MAG: NnrU family protein [Pseudomonadota bacterium]
MTGGLVHVGLAGLLVVITHVGLPGSPLRAVLIDRMGKGPYMALYSLISLGSFAWLWLAFRAVQAPALLWHFGAVGAWLPLGLVPVALVMLADGILWRGEPRAHGLRRITRRPMPWAVALWSLAHLIANGMAHEMIFFGTMLALGLFGAVTVDRREAAKGHEAYRAQTSNIPFAAILDGRQSLRPVIREMGWKPFALGLALAVILIGAHPFLFGVYPHPI